MSVSLSGGKHSITGFTRAGADWGEHSEKGTVLYCASKFGFHGGYICGWDIYIDNKKFAHVELERSHSMGGSIATRVKCGKSGIKDPYEYGVSAPIDPAFKGWKIVLGPSQTQSGFDWICQGGLYITAPN